MKLYEEYLYEADSSNIDIKELPIKDYKILESLYQEFVKDTAKKTTRKYKPKTLKTKMEEVSKTKKHIILVAYDEELPIGYIIGYIDDKMKTGLFHGALGQIIVSNKYRGQGIAKNLWSILDKWLDKNNANVKWVTVLAGNKEAIGLYKSFGFKPELLTMRM